MDTEAHKCFKTLKQRVKELPTLDFPDFSKVFQVDFDASGSVIEVILSQEGRLVTFYSKNLNDAKKRYSFYDQEFYTIVEDSKKWRHYLMTKYFVF